jgi:hypothetical protein
VSPTILAISGQSPKEMPFTVTSSGVAVSVSHSKYLGVDIRIRTGHSVTEALHMISGRHTETGATDTVEMLGSGRPTLQHRKDPGPRTGLDREHANAAAEKDNPRRSSYERAIGRN